MNIDNHWVAVPLLLTVLLSVKFLFSGLKNLRFKLTVLALFVSFFWIDSYLRSNDPRDGLSYWTRPIQNTFLRAHPTAMLFMIWIFWLVIFWVLMPND
ncbi:MAG: hypothetical protein ABSA96_10135 [Candidatus Acidiferrales bacterium]|jgi:hypothetical protein